MIVDSVVTVLNASEKCEEFFSILSFLEKMLAYNSMIVMKNVTSASLRILSTKLLNCLSSILDPEKKCCDACSDKFNRELIIRMAGFVSGYD